MAAASVVPSSGTGTVYYGQGHPVQTVSSSAVPPPVQTVPQQQAYQPTYYYQHQPVAAQPQHPPNAASVTTSVQPQSQQVATIAPAGSHPGSSYATQQGYTYSYPDYTTPPPQVPTMMMVPPIPPPAPHPQHSDPYYQTVQGNGAMGVPQQGHVTQPPMQTQHGVMSPSLTSGFSGSGADCKSTETSSILSAASYSSGAAPHVNNNYNYGDHSQYYSNKKGGYHNYYNNNNNQQQLDYNTMGSSYNGHHNHHGASSNPSSRSYGSSSSGNSGSSSSSKNNQSSSTGTNNMHGNLVDTGVCGSGNSLQVNSKLTSGGSGACHAPTVTNNSNMNSHGISSKINNNNSNHVNQHKMMKADSRNSSHNNKSSLGDSRPLAGHGGSSSASTSASASAAAAAAAAAAASAAAMAAASAVFCETCQIAFPSLAVLENHLKGSRHARRIKSQQAFRQLKDAGTLFRIRGSSASVTDIGMSSGAIRCEVCQVSVNSSHQLQAHLTGRYTL